MITFVLIIYTVFVGILFFYSLHSFVLIYYYFHHKRNRQQSVEKKLKNVPYVTVQLPVYNERFVVHRLLKSVVELDYPRDKLEIQVIDDSDDETVAVLERLVACYSNQGFCIEHIRRGTRTGFKAGALQYGLERARGEFIAIFDADFIVPRYFLKEMLPEFRAANIGGVQARWGHLNADSFLTRSQAISLDNHFAMEQRLRSYAGCFISFNGTCGVWSKQAIIEAGGWHGDTLAEDLDLSYRVQLKGWSIKYRNDIIVDGELPANAYGYRIQQNRWAKGTIQVARKLLPLIWRSSLRPFAKYESFVHLTCHVNFVAMLGLAVFSVPIVYFKITGIVPDAYFIALSFCTIGAFGYPVSYYLSQRDSYRDYKRRIPFIFGVIAYSMGLSVSNTKAIIEGLFDKGHVFVRTPKTGGTSKSYLPTARSIIPLLEVLLGFYMCLGLVYVTAHVQLILVPFLLLYAIGFLSMGFSSLFDGIRILHSPEVLCSKKSS